MVKLNEDLKELDDKLGEEQVKTQEMKEQIDEYKERMAAQNLEISNRIAEKEKIEAQVRIFFSSRKLFINNLLIDMNILTDQ